MAAACEPRDGSSPVCRPGSRLLQAPAVAEGASEVCFEDRPGQPGGASRSFLMSCSAEQRNLTGRRRLSTAAARWRDPLGDAPIAERRNREKSSDSEQVGTAIALAFGANAETLETECPRADQVRVSRAAALWLPCACFHASRAARASSVVPSAAGSGSRSQHTCSSAARAAASAGTAASQCSRHRPAYVTVASAMWTDRAAASKSAFEAPRHNELVASAEVGAL